MEHSSTAPSAAPASLAIGILNSTALNVTWQLPPADQINGIVEYYSVKVHVSDTSEDFDYETSTTSLVLNDLHPYYTYTVLVAAATIATGPYSAGVSAQTPADGK